MDAHTSPLLSVVIPMYNEQDAFPLMAQRLRPALESMGLSYEVVAVDDGSADGTASLLHATKRKWPQLRIIRLRRNCGHQAALTAGLKRARGDYVVSIDADLQDPPEKIPEMLALAQKEGLDIVYGVRDDRSTDTWAKRNSAAAYYRLVRRFAGVKLQSHAGDFRLLSRAAVDVLRGLPEHQPVYRLLVPWIGFPSGQVTYAREERVAGRTKYPFGKMLRLAADSMINFSAAPLRLATWLGVAGFVLCMFMLVGSVVIYLLGHTVPGWTSLLVAVVFLGAVQLLCLGLLGEYVSRIYGVLQRRPAYFIGYDSDDAATPFPRLPEAEEAVTKRGKTTTMAR